MKVFISCPFTGLCDEKKYEIKDEYKDFFNKLTEKLENMGNIESCIPEAYKIMQKITSKDRFVSNIVRYATKKVELREKDSKAKKLAQEYEEQLPESQNSIDEG